MEGPEVTLSVQLCLHLRDLSLAQRPCRFFLLNAGGKLEGGTVLETERWCSCAVTGFCGSVPSAAILRGGWGGGELLRPRHRVRKSGGSAQAVDTRGD